MLTRNQMRMHYVSCALQVYDRARLRTLYNMWIPHNRMRTKTRYSKRAWAMQLAWAMLPHTDYVQQTAGIPSPDPGETQPEGRPAQ